MNQRGRQGMVDTKNMTNPTNKPLNGDDDVTPATAGAQDACSSNSPTRLKSASRSQSRGRANMNSASRANAPYYEPTVPSVILDKL